MFDIDQYCLLDFGDGRKLERFGDVVLDRPSPAAAGLSKLDPQCWQTATSRFVAAGRASAGCGQRGHWEPEAVLPDRWTIEHPPLVFELRPTEFGHVGIFPEQAENWDWVARQVSRHRASAVLPSLPGRSRGRVDSPRILNMFAYTGGSTLAAAAAGAAVVHVDASKGAVGWARRNAELSGLSTAPVRWITEDARRFVARELKRGNRYDGIILDPPSYGHGPKGEAWQLDRDLPQLLAGCGTLLAVGAFVLLTCHSPGITPRRLRALLSESLRTEPVAEIDARDLHLTTLTGRLLHNGVAARWTCC